MSLLSWLRKKALDKTIQDLVSEDTKCQEIVERIETAYGVFARPLSLTNLSIYFFIDMLERAFGETSIALPPELNVLDVGTAGWYYAPALLSFLKCWREPRIVNLEGIDFPKKDYQEAIEKLQQKHDLKMNYGDVIDFYPKHKFDIIFINHMISGPLHCKTFKVPYHPLSELLPHLQSLGKPGSLVVITAHTYAGESAIVNCFTQKSRLIEFIYQPSVGKSLSSLLSGYFGFHDNRICICRSPYVDSAACQEHDRGVEEWDKILDNIY